MAAFFGMATKYAEGLLAIHVIGPRMTTVIFRVVRYYILHGMGKWRPLATFAGCCVNPLWDQVMTQVNSVRDPFKLVLNEKPEVASVVIALVVSTVFLVGFTGFLI